MKKTALTLIAIGALIALTVPTLASATNATAIPVRHLPASGATIKWTVMIPRGTNTCRWASSPEVAGFDGTVTCKPGRLTRPATFRANASTRAKTYTLNLVMRGTTRTVTQLRVVEAGVSAPTTTTTLPPPTTTTTLPPQPSPPPAAYGSPSANWSGYVWEGANDGVSGQWTVPTLDCLDTPNGLSADWVGVNGDSYPGLFQTGVTDECLDGVQTDWAWFTDEAEGLGTDQYSPNDVFDDVSPSDVITAEVFLDTDGYWVYSITDLTSGDSTGNVEARDGNDYLVGAAGEAEWIEEDVGCPNGGDNCWSNGGGSFWDFPNFGAVTFTSLGLWISASSFTLPDSDAIAMTYPDGSVEASPSQSNDDGFTVTYESDGEMSSSARSTVIRHEQSTFVSSLKER